MLLLRSAPYLFLVATLGLGSAALAAAPTAVIEAPATVDCAHPMTGAEVVVDGSGSSDPDGDPLTYRWTDAAMNVLSTEPMPTLVLLPGSHLLTLTVDDGMGGTGSAQVTITVIADATPPVLEVGDGEELWPPNHKLHGFDSKGLVSAEDACDGDLSAQVVFGGATSDEADEAAGDGSTRADVLFTEDCRSADVRAERSGPGDGRVYLLELHVTDAANNTASSTYRIEVPHDRSGPATDSGPLAYYTSHCPAEGAGCTAAPEPSCTPAGAGEVAVSHGKKGASLRWRSTGFAAGSVARAENRVCVYEHGALTGGSNAPEKVKLKGKQGRGALAVTARGRGLARLASGQALRLELHDGNGRCVSYEGAAD